MPVIMPGRGTHGQKSGIELQHKTVTEYHCRNCEKKIDTQLCPKDKSHDVKTVRVSYHKIPFGEWVRD